MRQMLSRHTFLRNKMDEQPTNHQNSQSHDGNMEEIRCPDLQTLNNQLPNMSTIPNGTDMANFFPPNWHPGSSSFQFLRPPGMLPYNLFMAPTNSAENLMPNFNQNVPFFQAPSHVQSVDTQPSQKSSKRKQTGGAKGKEPWTVDEDAELCVAWLRISEDSVIGTSQRHGKFWQRIADAFNQQMKDKLKKDSSRTKDAVNSRWGTIHPAVTKWSALHATMTRNLESGWTVEQTESRVRSMYQSKYKEMFKFEKCWKILRDTYKWQTWKEERNEALEKGTQPVPVPPRSQQDKEYVDVDSEPPLTPNSERPVGPPSQLEAEKDKYPHFNGPASRDMPRPPGGAVVKNKRLRNKQLFSDQQTLLSDTISAALMGVEAKADDRSRRQEELKRRRDDILDMRFEEQKRLARKEHEFAMENHKTQLLNDVKLISDQLVEASRDLQKINQANLITPQEKFEYDMKREWVEMLQQQRAAKRRKLSIATSPLQSPEAPPSSSRVSTSKINPRRLGDVDWTIDSDA